VKLTAPPQTPTPPEQSGNDRPTPNDPSSSNSTPVEATASPTTPKTVTWPAWFAGADFLLITLALGLAFLVSSFVARNADIWLHLAAGQRLLSGEYHPGSDPFSYAANDRSWVNHSLLFDVGAYLLYKCDGDGVLLVILKALAVVLTFALLIGIRRPGYAYWPWAVVAGVAILAAAPRMLLSPIVGSTVLLAATLFLLFRFPHKRGSWQFPIAIGLVFWIWAQVDDWFILGPITLVLVLLGELLQAQFLKPATTAGSTSTPEPLGDLPDVPTLAKALCIGLLACMLNPHHVRIWELPFELAGMKEVETDPRLQLQVFLTPLSKSYYENSQFGSNLNGLAYALLFVGGGLVMALGVGRIRFAYIALWLGFALLSLTTVFAVPFFAVVAVPLVASQLNAYSSTYTLKDWDDPKTKFAILGSAAGRVVTLICLAAACVLAWPGWMQPPSNAPAYTRRVGWGIEPDAGLVRAARQLQSWRETGALPAETHGFIASVELANYCAWFAPREKVFLNGNYNQYRTELPEFLALRNAATTVNPKETEPLLKKIGAQYLVLASTQGDRPDLRSSPLKFSIGLWVDGDHWSPWYFDGRAAISGWNSAPERKRTAFPSPQVDPVSLAFGSGVERVPVPSVNPIPPPEGWEGEFLHGVGMSPPWADEAIGWLMYKELIQKRQIAVDQIGGMTKRLFIPTQGHHRLLTALSSNLYRPPPDELTAIPILAYRAARRAIAADPSHPDGYYALYRALADQDLPLSEAERTIGQVIALRQCLVRMPSPERIRKNSYLVPAYQVSYILANLYNGQHKLAGSPITGLPLDFPAHLPAAFILGTCSLSDGVVCLVEDNGRPRAVPWSERRQLPMVSGGSIRAIDLAHEMMVLALKYAEIELSADVEQEARSLSKLKSDAKSFETALVNKTQDWEHDKLQGGQKKIGEQLKLALRHNLVGEALKILTDKGPELAKEYGPNVIDIVLARIILEMATGRLEDATEDLKEAPSVLENSNIADSNTFRFKNAQVQALTYQKLLFEGNFAVAGELIENSVADNYDKDPPLTFLESTIKPGPFFASGSPRIALRIAELSHTPPFAIPLRSSLLSEASKPFFNRQQQLIDSRHHAADLLFQSGFSSLLQGDIPTAKRRFELSARSGVPEWGVPPQHNQYADSYLSLILKAENKTQK
jgi:hypothetical protein